MWEKHLPTPKIAKTTHTRKCWETALAPSQSTSHFGFQQLSGGQASKSLSDPTSDLGMDFDSTV